MQPTQQENDLVRQVSECMQAGPSREAEMISLFTDDAVLVEPFAGPVQTFDGLAAIKARYHEMVSQPRPDDFLLTLDQVSAEGGKVMADWTCTSQVLPGPMRGRSDYTIRDGKIARLEIQFLP